jgi:C-terminal processing protease CtpA/Prc
MSGLWIDQRGGVLLAGRVGKGSPAEKAGIVPGDRIAGMTFGPMIARLNGRAGLEVSLQVTRGGAKRDATLVLEDYL